MSLASLQKKTVWNSSSEDFGLTADQFQAEQKWLKAFNDTGDELDWGKWKEFWADDAFLTWDDKLRIKGMPALDKHFEMATGLFESYEIKVTTHSFDVPQGLIYQKADLIRVVKGDPEAKSINTPTMTIIHKRPGEQKLHGMEVFGDMSQITETIQAVMGKKPI
ncbi:hypothetical protein FRC09_007862 [Ceratobasidium sp. 395]|nr:hypothetical protein FRC09_007862 [Ceratobasidium sp. 395]